MALRDKMQLWMMHDSNSDSTYARRETIEVSDGFLEAEGDSYLEHPQIETDKALSAAIPGLEGFRESIVKSYAYEWLLNDLQRHCFRTSPDPNVMVELGDAIIHSLPPPSQLGKRKSALPFKMTYTMEWELVRFLEDQEYIETNSQALPMVITLTGYESAVQALTCSQYLHRTWPSSGGNVLRLLQSLLGLETNGRAKGKIPQEASLRYISVY